MHLMNGRLLVRSGIALVLVTVTAGAATAQGRGSSPAGKPFVALNDQIVEVQGTVADLQDQIDALVGRVDTIEERVDANVAAIASLEATDAGLAIMIAQNATDIASINSMIDTLQAENTALRNQINTQSGDIDALQAQVDVNTTAIGSLQAALLSVQNGLISLETDLQAQIDHNATLIVALQSEVDAINASLELKQAIVSGSCPAGYSIRQVNSDGTVECEFDDVTAGSGSLVSSWAGFSCSTIGASFYGSAQATSTTPGAIAVATDFHSHGMMIPQDIRTNLNSGSIYARNYNSYSEHLCVRVKFIKLQ